MSGRNVEFVATIAGRCALSVNDAGLPAPRGWVWTPLTDVARLESGHTPSRERSEYWNGDIPWIGIKDAREHHGGTIQDTQQRVTQAGIDNSAARVLPAKTVCLSRTASVGYVVIMGRPMATSQDFVDWVCSDAIEPEFLKWVFLAEGEEGLRKFGKGSTHTTIYFPEVKAFHVCLPPLNEQRRIVDKLDAIFEKSRAAKAHLERLPALLDKLKRSILAAAFRGDLTKDWRAANPDVEPASVLLERIRAERRRRWEEGLRAKGKDPKKAKYEEPAPVDANELPELPEGWAWVSIGEAAQIDVGFAFTSKDYSESGIRLVRGENIEPGRLRWTDTKCWPEVLVDQKRHHHLRVGDIVLAMDRPLVSAGLKLARVAHDDVPSLLVQRVARIVPFDESAKELLYLALSAPAFVDHLLPRQQGSDLPHISGSGIATYVFALPPAAEASALIQRVGRTLSMLDQMAVVARCQLHEVMRLEQAALAKAFRGDLVPQDPDDEPASLLLERIRAARAAEPAKPRRKQAAPSAPKSARSREPLDLIVAKRGGAGGSD